MLQQNIHGTSEFGEVYDSLCDDWKEFCGSLRAFADDELQQAVRAITKQPNDQASMAWYNFAVNQKDELNKDINFYEIELDGLINRDDVDMFLEQYKEILQSVQNMYNKSTMTYSLCYNSVRPAPSSKIPVRLSSETQSKLHRQTMLNDPQLWMTQSQDQKPFQVRLTAQPRGNFSIIDIFYIFKIIL